MEIKRKQKQQHLHQGKQTLNKDCYKREGRILRNDEGINPKGRCNNHKHICTQYRRTSIDRQILTGFLSKGEINTNTIIVGDFNTPLSSMDRSSRQKIHKETLALNETLVDIYSTFHKKEQDLHSFQGTGNFLQDHILGHKSNPGK